MNWDPMRDSVVVIQSDLSPIVTGNPNESSRDARASAECDKDGGSFLAISLAMLDRIFNARVLARNPFDVLPNPFVELSRLLPCCLLYTSPSPRDS